MKQRFVRSLFALLLLVGLSGLATAQGHLIIAQGTDPVKLDPHDVSDSPSATVLSHVFETLFDLTPEGEIVPHLAESYEVSDDGTVWTLHLRQDVTFHDGTPFNAEAVKVNLDRFLNPEVPVVFRFLLTRIQSVEVTGEYSVQITLSTPFAPFLAHLTHNTVSMISPAALEQYTLEELSETAVGTGPFTVESWQRGERITLARFDDYWGELPGVERVSFLTVPEGTTRMALVESGEAHVATRVPPPDVPRLNAHPEITVENVSSVRTIYIYFNHTMEPFTDRRVRQAINHAVDKELIAEFVFGGAVRPSDAPLPPGVFGYTPVGFYEYNPERARELLAEAGYPNGFNTTLYCPSGRYLQDIQTCEAIQPQLAEVGINAEIETMEWTSYLEFTGRGVNENTVPMGMLGWGTVTGDADYGLFALFHTSEHVPNGSNRSFYSNALVDDLLNQARSTADNAVREQLYADIMQILWDDAAWLYLHSETQLVAVRDNVEGLVIHPTERILALTASLR
jgi:peptide/nickel transport system substrate-binding protein